MTQMTTPTKTHNKELGLTKDDIVEYRTKMFGYPVLLRALMDIERSKSISDCSSIAKKAMDSISDKIEEFRKEIGSFTENTDDTK